MINRNKKIIFCIMPIVVTFLFVMTIGIQYAIVDDILINYITEGIYGTGKNQIIILPYLGVIFTSVLAILKSIFTSLNVYLIVMYGCLTLSFVVLQFLFCNKYQHSIFNLIMILAQFVLLNYFTYTVIAYLLCFVGLLLLYEKPKKLYIVLGGLFLLIGISIRKDVFVSLFIIFLPIIYYYWKKDKRSILNVALSFALFVIVIISNNIVIQQYPQTQQYLYWNDLSTQIRDYAPIQYSTYEDILSQQNISKNDLDCLYSWIFTDKETLGETQLQLIAEQRSFFDTYELNPIKLLDNFISQPFYIMFIIMALLVLLFFKFKNLLIPSIMFFTLADLGALLVRQRVVDRVFIPILFVCFALIIYEYKDGQMIRRFKDKNLYKITLVVSCFATLFYGVNNKNWFNIATSYKPTQIYQYVHDRPENLYIFASFSSLVSNQYTVKSFMNNKNQFNNNIMTLGNWDTYSERYFTQMSKFDIDDPENFLSHLPEYNHVYFIMRDDHDKKELIEKWFQEHIHKNIVFTFVDSIDNLEITQIRWEN